jgi:hypothetical protein|tara:strand:- start:845 stop:958 length:114 start_codon:yes stop_codon:yes gene_type:complete
MPVPEEEERKKFGLRSPEEYRLIPIAKGMIANYLKDQ